MDVRLYRSGGFQNEQEQFERAKRIFSTFINSRNVLEINLPQKIVLDIQEVLLSYEPLNSRRPSPMLCNLFAMASKEVYVSLAGLYPGWLSSNAYKCMVADVDSEAKVHPRSTRQIAASRLLKFFDSERQFIEDSSFSIQKETIAASTGFAIPSPNLLSRSVSPYSPVRESHWLRMTPQEFETFYWLSNAFSKNEIGLEFID